MSPAAAARIALAAVAAVRLLAGALAAPAAAGTTAPTCAPLVLHPALATPQPGDIFLRAGAATCTTLEIEVRAQTVGGLFTAGFDLRYPAALLKYEGYAPGPILGSGTPKTRPLFLVQNSAPGALQVTMTRFAPDGDVAIQGSGTLVVLRFSRVAPGEGPIDFDQAAASPIAERIVDASGAAVSARFGPGHGATVTAP